MNDDRLLHEVERFYRARSAAPETVEFLCELARRDAPDALAAKRIPMARRVVAIAAACAALVGALAIGYRWGLNGAAAVLPPDDGPKTVARETGSAARAPDDSPQTSVSEAEAHRGMEVVATIPAIEGENDPPPDATGAARLLLMRVYAAWCPRSPRLAPAYDKLVERYKNEPLLIVSFDVTDASKRRQAGYMAHSLGVLKLLGHKWEPSTILLIDREKGEIVEIIREVEEQPAMEIALGRHLPH